MFKIFKYLFFALLTLFTILEPVYARVPYRGGKKSYIIEFAMLAALALYLYVKDKA